jgi:hypothetical protein
MCSDGSHVQAIYRLYTAAIWTHFPELLLNMISFSPSTFETYCATLYCIVFSDNLSSTWRWPTHQCQKHVVETSNNIANIVVLWLPYPRIITAKLLRVKVHTMVLPKTEVSSDVMLLLGMQFKINKKSLKCLTMNMQHYNPSNCQKLHNQQCSSAPSTHG